MAFFTLNHWPNSNQYVVFTGDGPNEYILPDAQSTPGRSYVFKNQGTGPVTISAPNGQTIDGEANFVLTSQYDGLFVFSDGDNWNTGPVSGEGGGGNGGEAGPVLTVQGVGPDGNGNITLPTATTSGAGLMSAADKTKLNGIEEGATANATDAQLRNRATHTGTQPASTITGLAPVATSGSFEDLTGFVTESQLDSALAAKINNLVPSKLDATEPPTVNDDETEGWMVGSMWIDTVGKEAYRCVDATEGAAVWIETTLSTSELATVALSGNYSDLNGRPNLAAVATSGSYDDLSDKPVLATVATSGSYNDLEDLPSLGSAAAADIEDFATAAQGALAATAVQPSDLATVATTGSYDDLTDKPSLATVATSGSYNDLTDKPSLAAVATSGSFSDLSGSVTEEQLDAGLAAKINNIVPSKLDATEPPTVDDDETQGWMVGSVWIDTEGKEAYRCVDATEGAAVWIETTLTTDELATVALTGNYSDLSGRPTLGTAAAANIVDFATAAQGALADTAVQPGDLAAVATSGSYNDLEDLPSLGSAAAADIEDFATAAQGALADTAVQPDDLAAVATSGSYNDLEDTPTLATVATTGAYSDLTGTPGVATTSTNGLMSSTDKAKLDGIEEGATANSSDEDLLDRSNHTGTQAATTVTVAAYGDGGVSAGDLQAVIQALADRIKILEDTVSNP